MIEQWILERNPLSLVLELPTSSVDKAFMELISSSSDRISQHTHEVTCFDIDNLPCQLQNVEHTEYGSYICT